MMYWWVVREGRREGGGMRTYVVPVALAGLEHGALELERALPCAGLGRGLVLGEGKLAGVVVP
jgi:hypothetical protein